MGIKVLGKGGFGIAGLWSKRRGLKPGGQQDVLNEIPLLDHVIDVVVKHHGGFVSDRIQACFTSLSQRN